MAATNNPADKGDTVNEKPVLYSTNLYNSTIYDVIPMHAFHARMVAWAGARAGELTVTRSGGAMHTRAFVYGWADGGAAGDTRCAWGEGGMHRACAAYAAEGLAIGLAGMVHAARYGGES